MRQTLDRHRDMSHDRHNARTYARQTSKSNKDALAPFLSMGIHTSPVATSTVRSMVNGSDIRYCTRYGEPRRTQPPCAECGVAHGCCDARVPLTRCIVMSRAPHHRTKCPQRHTWRARLGSRLRAAHVHTTLQEAHLHVLTVTKHAHALSLTLRPCARLTRPRGLPSPGPK
jgi:hypothetical protein